MHPFDKQVEKFALGGRGLYRGTLHVGLVNNMADGLMRATELQFAGLLKEAAGGQDVRLHLFSLPQIERGELARSRMEGFYADAGSLPMAGLDALIVTGGETGTPDLRDEIFWNALAHLVDWAEIGTISTLFSSRAGHAAVLHLDGIQPRPLPHKLSGVFAARRACHDPLLTGLPERIEVPHSRRAMLAERDLVGAGYRVLSRLDGGEVNIFARNMPGRCLFLFLEGHPEYGGETLGREYLRDMECYLRGESAARPGVPENYFDRATENHLAALDNEGGDISRYREAVCGAVPLQSWRAPTVKLFGNWLGHVAAEKARRQVRGRLEPRRRLRLTQAFR